MEGDYSGGISTPIVIDNVSTISRKQSSLN